MFLITLALVVCAAAKDESLPEMKTRLENARLDDQPELAIKIAEFQLHDADRLYKDGKSDEARAAVTDIVAYSQKASDAALQSNKHLKNVEIDVRKIADKLRDIKRTLAFEDQPAVDQAIRNLEDIRTKLLNEMFAKQDKKGKK